MANLKQKTTVEAAVFCGVPGTIRTSDLLLRRRLLYPPELRARDLTLT